MTEHLPECPILKPCCDDEQFPEHGFCGNFVGRCLHCMAECICDALRACEERVLNAAREAVSAVLAHEDHCREKIRNYCNCSRFEALNAIDTLREEQP